MDSKRNHMERIIKPSFITDIDSLKIVSCDIKEMDLEHYYKLKRSIQDHGQLRNILIDGAGNVVEGRKIAAIMRELGYKQIEVKVVDSEDVGMLCRLALDSEYSTFDFVKVSIQLSKTFDLHKKEQLYDRLPFKNIDIDDYIEAVSFSFDTMNSHKNNGLPSLFGDM